MTFKLSAKVIGTGRRFLATKLTHMLLFRMQGPITGCLVLGAEPLKLGPGQPIEVPTSKLRQERKVPIFLAQK